MGKPFALDNKTGGIAGQLERAERMLARLADADGVVAALEADNARLRALLAARPDCKPAQGALFFPPS